MLKKFYTLAKANKENICDYPNVGNIKSITSTFKKNFYTEKELNQLIKTTPDIWKDIKKLMNSYKKFLTIDKKRCRMALLTCINNNTN